MSSRYVEGCLKMSSAGLNTAQSVSTSVQGVALSPSLDVWTSGAAVRYVGM